MKKKIIFVSHDFKFIDSIIEKMKDSDKYEIKKDHWKGHNIHEKEVSIKHIEWSDIIFCEWGLGNVVWYQKNKKENQKLYVRLHRAEMNANFFKEFDYSKIDKFIVVSSFAFEEFSKKCGIPRDKMIVIPNSVDIAKFDVEKNLEVSEFNIGMVGFCPINKRLDLALEILDKLLIKNKKYKLYLKGKKPKELKWIWENEEEKKYFEEILKKIDEKHKENIIFEEWGDTSDFFKKVKYTLSLSDYESFHLAPIEGMVSGTIPLVLNSRPGIKGIFPNDYIFETTDEIARFILNRNSNINKSLKDFVKEKYSLDKVNEEIEKLISLEEVIVYSNLNNLVVESKEDSMKYFYYDVKYNKRNPVVIPEINWKNKGEILTKYFLIEYNTKGTKLNVNSLENNNTRIIELDKNTSNLKLAIRKEYKGTSVVSDFKLKFYNSVEAANNKIMNRRNINKNLVLTNVYPSNEDLYKNGFVHVRVKEYIKNDVEVDVYTMKPNGNKIGKYFFDGIEVFNGDKEALTLLLDSKKYEKILIHFINPDMVEGIKKSKKNHKLIAWHHGFGSMKMERRKDFFATEEEYKKNLISFSPYTKMWKKILREKNCEHIFVSRWIKKIFELDFNSGKEIVKSKIIPNPIDMEHFTFEEKKFSDKLNVLSIKSHATKMYANDIIENTIMELSKKWYFNDLHFTLVGDGLLFEKNFSELLKLNFKNVEIKRTFMTQEEIKKMHKQNQIFLAPTRMDTHGVSRAEAAASGLITMSTEVAAIPEFLTNEGGVLASYESIEEYVSFFDMYFASSSKTIYSKLARNGSNQVMLKSGTKGIIKKELKLL